LSDPFVAGDRVYFDHAYLFLPLLALVAAIAFESRSYIMRNASSNAIKSRMAGPIIAALFLPTAYCALIEGGTAVGGDVRFACQTPSLCVAGFWSVSIAIVVAAGFFAPAPMKADDRWFLVGWAAPNVFVINFEGFKYLGQSIMRSPGGVDEYALGGIFYWFLASMIGLLAVPLFVALFFEPEPREQQSSMNEACAACVGDGV
jgi:hypothetical protein